MLQQKLNIAICQTVSFNFQARKIEIYQEVEEILARHLASIHRQLEDLYQRLGRLERKAVNM